VDQEQQSRWRPTRTQLLWAGGIAALAFLVIVICDYLFGWLWTGLPKQTLWDWKPFRAKRRLGSIGATLRALRSTGASPRTTPASNSNGFILHFRSSDVLARIIHEAEFR
jgi:hypothetical protein